MLRRIRENWRKTLRYLVIIAVIGLVLQIIIPIFYTHNDAIPPNDNAIKLVTYNIHGSLFSDMVDVVSDIDADIIALQEISTFYDVDINGSVYDFAASLGLNVVEFDNYNYEEYRLVLLSRYPVISSEFIDCSFLSITNSRGVQQAVFQTPQGQLQVINTHLNTPNFYTTRIRQLNIILDNFETDENTILMGDLNTPNYIIDYTYNKLSIEFEDAWVVSGNFHGFGKTYHSDVSFLRVDYIFVSEDIGVVENSAQLLDYPDLSDHKGLMTEIMIDF